MKCNGLRVLAGTGAALTLATWFVGCGDAGTRSEPSIAGGAGSAGQGGTPAWIVPAGSGGTAAAGGARNVPASELVLAGLPVPEVERLGVLRSEVEAYVAVHDLAVKRDGGFTVAGGTDTALYYEDTLAVPYSRPDIWLGFGSFLMDASADGASSGVSFPAELVSEARAIAVADNGDIFFAGGLQALSIPEAPELKGVAFVARRSPAFEPLWHHSFGPLRSTRSGSIEEYVSDIQVGRGDTLLVTGKSSNLRFQDVPLEGGPGFVVALRGDGRALWGRALPQVPHVLFGDNAVLLTYSDGPDLIVERLDLVGALQWSVRTPLEKAMSITGIVPDREPDSALILTKDSVRYDIVDVGAVQFDQIGVVRVASGGAVTPLEPLIATGAPIGGVVADSRGFIVWGELTHELSTRGYTLTREHDVFGKSRVTFAIAYDRDLSPRWAAFADTDNDASLKGLRVMPDGRVLGFGELPSHPPEEPSYTAGSFTVRGHNSHFFYALAPADPAAPLGPAGELRPAEIPPGPCNQPDECRSGSCVDGTCAAP